MFNVKGIAIGKFDKNKVEVCEGDILRQTFRTHYSCGQLINRIIKFVDSIVEWDEELCGFKPFCITGYDGETCDSEDVFEIIGSIYKEVCKCPYCNKAVYTLIDFHSCKKEVAK